MTERILGANMKRLLAYKVARDAIPAGGGFLAGLDFLMDREKMMQVSRDALVWVDQAIAAVKAAPDNPYGDSEEVIALAILSKLEKKYPSD